MVLSLKVDGAEVIIMTALGDTDDKVRWRAMNGLAELAAVSADSIKKPLNLITAEAPEDKEQAVAHYRKIAQLIRALGGINAIPNREEAEDAQKAANNIKLRNVEQLAGEAGATQDNPAPA